MAGNVKITSKGIRKVLKNYNSRLALAEYIWNGFDAGAHTVQISYTSNSLGTLEYLEVSDNGSGIDMEQLHLKFHPFYDSEKAVEIHSPKHTSIMHGKNGIGRLTFFTFSHRARWRTTFERDKKLVTGSIQISVDGLNTYHPTWDKESSGTQKGTQVSFYDVHLTKEELETIVLPFLREEFCWFLELHKNKGYQIIVNDIPLNYATYIEDREEGIQIQYEKSNTLFTVKYLRWSNTLHKELSKYYFLNEQGEEVFKDYTTLNKQGDEFYHSVYIQSEFFNDFDFKSNEEHTQTTIFGKARSSPEYKYLIKSINEYLKLKRKPFLRLYAQKLLAQYDQEGIMPAYKNDDPADDKKNRLKELLIALYEVQPKLFSGLNTDQKKTLVRTIGLVLDSDKSEELLQLIKSIIDLDPDDQKYISDLFH